MRLPDVSAMPADEAEAAEWLETPLPSESVHDRFVRRLMGTFEQYRRETGECPLCQHTT